MDFNGDENECPKSFARKHSADLAAEATARWPHSACGTGACA